MEEEREEEEAPREKEEEGDELMEAERDGELEREEEKESPSSKPSFTMLAVAEVVLWCCRCCCCCCCCVGCGRRGGSRGLIPLRARFFLAAKGTGCDGMTGICEHECEETKDHRKASSPSNETAST